MIKYVLIMKGPSTYELSSVTDGSVVVVVVVLTTEINIPLSCTFLALHIKFVPRDAMQVQPCGVSVCVCVCPSVTSVHSVKTNKHIFTFFHHRVATPL